ncbi:MAG: glycine zipper family protein [Pseudonocardia sp.]|nr:glycine zipper family protein [Pseudonocardia sp.]
MQQPSRVVASFPDYAGAQYTVDALADRRFPVDGLAIVGANLQSFEQVTGRRGYGRAALEGVTSGALVGVLVGWLFGLFSFVAPLVSALVLGFWGVVIGGVVGLVVGLVGQAMSGGRRDFSSISSVRAERYDVLAAAEIADVAERAITELKPAPSPR